MRTILMATLLVGGLAWAAAAADNTLVAVPVALPTAAPPAAPGEPAAVKPKADEKGAKVFTAPNPFAPLPRPEEPKPKLPEPSADDTASGKTGAAAAMPSGKSATSAPPVPKLNGILFSQHLTVAIIDDTMVRVGDQLDGYRITAIEKDTVTAEKEGTMYVMTTRQPGAQVKAAPPVAATQPPAEPDLAETLAETQLSGPPPNADKPSEAEDEGEGAAVSPPEKSIAPGDKKP